MKILLGFAPFILFLILTRLVSLEVALAVNTAIVIVLVGREWLHTRWLKILDAGNVVLFGGLTAAVFLAPEAWTLSAARLVVDAGLLVIVLVSILVRQPFTLGYAREQVPQEFWSSPVFIRTNYIITSVWAGAFALSLLANLAKFLHPELPLWLNIAAEVVAIGGAIWFTRWYSARVRARRTQEAAARSS